MDVDVRCASGIKVCFRPRLCLQKCGEPMLRNAFGAAPTPAGGKRPERPKDGGRQQGCVDVDEWTYNPGYGQFLTTLRFENGKVVSIEYGDRVK
jgi:hypothetical protein